MKNNRRIDEYAQSMFRFEHLNDSWIKRCAAYLKHVFGERIKGRTVVDYAFGRGNWSLAFLQAGAAKVIAIDAAVSNVRKLIEYARQNNIDGLEVVEGNILHEKIKCEADIIWVYGILHHIAKSDVFLGALSGLARDDAAESILYAYNNASLREAVVNIGRAGLTYQSYDEFLEDSFLFSPAARLRARDDLTAPYVRFYARSQLWDLARSSGHLPLRFVQSFQQSEGITTPEFSPHHLHCRMGEAVLDVESGSVSLPQDEKPSIDIQIVSELGQALMQNCDSVQRKKVAIGLFNTHFSTLADGGYERCLQDDFLYLLYACMAIGLTPQTELQEAVMDLSQCALQGKPRQIPKPESEESAIFRHITRTNIRI